MLHRIPRRDFGFTLTELAIVLAVVGVLTAGLYNLLSGANQQVRDQSAATQQTQLISAVKAFLNSNDGQSYMTNNTACGGNCSTTPLSLALPTTAASNAGCNTSVANMPSGGSQATTWCSTLPPGFSTSTTNSYGQIYLIQILRDSTQAGIAPVTYSFMILTSEGTTLTDTSGARVSSLIGNDGGFIYSTNVCGSNTHFACGAYGAWSTDLSTYGFGYPGSGGYVASRTYMAPQNSLSDWLARILMPGDNSNQPYYNTMQTNLFLGGVANTFYLGSQITSGGNPVTTGGGTINLQGGFINGVDTATPINPIIELATGCSEISTPGCPGAINITSGDINMSSGELNANTVYANTFIYQSGVGGSDIRLKKNIRPLSDSLDNIMRLNPVSFDFRSDGKPSLGVIAQDVEKIYPQLVINGPDGMKAVNYNGLIAPLIDAVQELKKENDQLRLQIKEQAERQDELEKKLQARDSPVK